MMRFGPFAFAIFLSMLPISATVALAESRPIVLAELQEESIPAQDLAAPSPARCDESRRGCISRR